MIAKVNMYVSLKFSLNWSTNMRYGKEFISPILLVIFLLLQFEFQYLKDHKRYRSEILPTSRVR